MRPAASEASPRPGPTSGANRRSLWAVPDSSPARRSTRRVGRLGERRGRHAPGPERSAERRRSGARRGEDQHQGPRRSVDRDEMRHERSNLPADRDRSPNAPAPRDRCSLCQPDPGSTTRRTGRRGMRDTLPTPVTVPTRAARHRASDIRPGLSLVPNFGLNRGFDGRSVDSCPPSPPDGRPRPECR